MQQRYLLAATLAAAFSSSTCVADDHYLRASMGRVQPGLDSFADDTGWTVGVGWRFNDYLSAEAAYNVLGDFEGSAPGAGGSLDSEVDSYELGMAAKAPLGRSGIFAQARLGAHRWTNTLSNVTVSTTLSGVDPYFGIGLGYDLTELFGINLSLERYRVDNENFDRLMLGFELR